MKEDATEQEHRNGKRGLEGLNAAILQAARDTNRKDRELAAGQNHDKQQAQH